MMGTTLISRHEPTLLNLVACELAKLGFKAKSKNVEGKAVITELKLCGMR